MREPSTLSILLREGVEVVLTWGARWSMQILVLGGFSAGVGFGLVWWVKQGGCR